MLIPLQLTIFQQGERHDDDECYTQFITFIKRQKKTFLNGLIYITFKKIDIKRGIQDHPSLVLQQTHDYC